MGLILDSSVVIAAERRGDTPEQLVEQSHWQGIKKQRFPRLALQSSYMEFTGQIRTRDGIAVKHSCKSFGPL